MARERGKVPTNTNKELLTAKHGSTKEQILSKPPIDYKSIKKIEVNIPARGSNSKPPIDQEFVKQEYEKGKEQQAKLREPKAKEFTKRIDLDRGKD